MTWSSSHCPRRNKDGDTFLESLDSRKILDPSCRGSHFFAVDAAWTRMVPTWLERWEELLRLDQRDRWSGDSHQKRSGEILGHVEDRFFFLLFSDVETTQCEEEDGRREDTETA